MNLQLVAIAIFIGILGYLGYTLYTQYRASSATGWHRYLDAAEGSATILWQKFVMVVSVAAGGLASIAEYFNEPSISSAIQAALKPQYVAAFMVFVAVITIWARKRTL